jgi:PAS domain S-box-containing protein
MKTSAVRVESVLTGQHAAPFALRSYVAALVLVALATGCTWLMWPFSKAVSYSFYYLAIVGAALYGGWRAGALAVTAGAIAGDYFFIRPYEGKDALEAHLAVFAMIGAITILLIEALRLSNTRLRANHARLSLDMAQRERAEEALRESQARLQSIFDQSIAGIARTDLAGRFVEVNDRYCAITGRSREALLNLRMQDITAAEDLKENLMLFERLARDGSGFTVDKRYRRPDGTPIWVNNSVTAVSDAAGRPQFAVAVVLDISARKAAEDALRESELRFRAVFDQSAEFIGLLALDGTLRDCNNSPLRAAGWRREEVLGRKFWEAGWWSGSIEVQETLRRDFARARQGETIGRETVYYARNEERIAERVLTPIRYDGGDIVWILAEARDITERKRAEFRLQAAQGMTAYLDKAREEERARIARELHDDLGGTMTGVRMHLRMALSSGGETLAGVREQLQHAIELADSATQSVHRIISDLRPSVLDHLGVWAAIDWLADQWQARTGLSCLVAIDDVVRGYTLSGERATGVFRIVQESLTNVARHAGATQVDIHAHLDRTTLTLEVCDNGKGITQERLLSLESAGLLGMHERACRLGGELNVRGEAGAGTRVVLRLLLLK